jgi:hypothetical protein
MIYITKDNSIALITDFSQQTLGKIIFGLLAEQDRLRDDLYHARSLLDEHDIEWRADHD